MRKSITASLLGIATSLLFLGGFSAQAEDAKQESKSILFLGDSLTAGYGLDPSQAYPALIEKRLAEEGLPYRVIAAGLSGETSAGGLRRINWVMRGKVDMLVLALGANDGLRGINLADTRRNLQGIIDKAKEKNPRIGIVMAGMQMPPNLGKAYTDEFKMLYREIASANEADLIPFLLEGVGGVRKLNLPDGIHPNAEGHKILADNVWQVLEPLLME